MTEHINEILFFLAVMSPIMTSVATVTWLKAQVNGTKDRVVNIEAVVQRIEGKVDSQQTRISVIEARCAFREAILPTDPRRAPSLRDDR